MTKKARNMSIQWKIFFYLLAFCGILLLVLWLYQIVFLGRFYRFVKIGEVQSSATAIARNLDRNDFPEFLEQLAAEKQVGVEVIIGRSRYAAGSIPESILPLMSGAEKTRLLQRAVANGGEIMVYYNRDRFRESRQTGAVVRGRMAWLGATQQNTILYARVLKDPQGQEAAILINSVIAPVAATVRTLRVQFYYIAGLMLLLSVGLALLMAKRVAQPIEGINARARTLAAGDYAADFRGGGYREIDELADTLNYAAKELSRVDQLRRELMANVSHDLRTPLTLISGYAEAMRDLPGEASPENARIIAEETRRLTSLVNDMLDIARLESGKQPVRMRKYNMTRSLEETIRRLNLLVQKEQYSIDFQASQEVWVEADEELIVQAFYNLLINAIHHTGTDRSVRVTQEVEKGRAIIQVRDSGAGIDPNHLPYIWDRYYRAEQAHRRPITGSGLGLSIVRWVMEQHQAEYGVHSDPSQGSEFWFSVLIVPPESPSENEITE